MFGIKRLADDCKNEDILEEVDCKTNDKKEIEDETISFPEYSATVFKYLNKDIVPNCILQDLSTAPYVTEQGQLLLPLDTE